MNWIDLILPYRFWLKSQDLKTVKTIQADFLPKSYNPSLLIPGYRKKIKEKNVFLESSGSFAPLFKLANFDVSHLEKDFKKVNDAFLNNKDSFITAAEATMFLGYDAFNAYQSVDEYVYEGISRLSGENLDNLANLSAKVQSYDHSFWDGLTESGVRKVGGHIGEVHAAKSLADKGIDVKWPEASNQEGWDLLINGHEMNVKMVADASTLSEHFSKYPDIPIVIPGDAANIPEHAIAIDSDAGLEELNKVLAEETENVVAVAPSLSNQEIMSHTEEATDFLTGTSEIFESYIPMITAGLSSFREIQLLDKGHTSAKNAAKNILLDSTGTGLGAFGGAKAGAVLGSAILPGIGTAIGGVLGGIGGAFMGKRVTNNIKESAFKKVYDSYNKEFQSFRIRKQIILNNADENIRKLKNKLSEDIRFEKIKVKEEINEIVGQMSSFRKKLYNLRPNEIKLFKKKVLFEIQELENNILVKKKARNKFNAVFFPSSEDFAIFNCSQKLKKMKESIKSIYFYKLKPYEFIEIIGEFGLQKELIVNYMADKELDRYKNEKECQEKIESLISNIVKKRHDAISKSAVFITETTQKAHESIREGAQKIQKKLDLVNIEKRKLGMK